MPSNLDIRDYTSIIHMTTGEDRGLGGRIPGLWYHSTVGLRLHAALDGKGGVGFSPASQFAIGQWTKIQISQELEDQTYKLKFFIDDENKLDVVNSKPSEFQNVKVYAADPWWTAQPGSVKSLAISVKEPAK